MDIRDLFEPSRDPSRHLNEVVNAETQLDLKGEVDEYVFTEHTLRYLTTLIEGVLDTAQGREPECLRLWISGFFGSGKSHFLKLAASLLSNSVELPDGASMHALAYAAQRHNVALPWQRVAKDFVVRAVLVNLAVAVGGSAAAQSKPLLHRLRNALCQAAGDAPVAHIAEVERELRKAKKWDAFIDAVKAESEAHDERDDFDQPATWEGWYRLKATTAHRLLGRVLPKVFPRFGADAAAVELALSRMEQDSPSPEKVVEEAVELARHAHPEYGRVLLCVDEVALYLQGNSDRVREVQGLAETVKAKGKGKVFLWVTAQQRVDAIDIHFAASDGKVVFLRDRFPERFPLEERDIDQVVRERWLRKDPARPAYAALQKLLRDHGGALARACSLHEQNVLREDSGLTDDVALLAYYPCLPYHVRLTQAVLAALRGEKQVDLGAAQSRALLTSIRMLFVRQNGAGLAERPVGDLVTFDVVYDVIRELVRKADNATDLWITDTIDKLGAVDSLKVSSVAKVIFLLQRLNPGEEQRIKVDAENVAALLYPRIGEPWEPHLLRVRGACELLHSRHFIGDHPQRGYRFYRQEERSLQELVDRQSVDQSAVVAALRAAADAVAKKDGLTAFAWKPWHKLDVTVTAHVGVTSLPNPNAAAKSLELHLVFPGDGGALDAKRIASQYAGAKHVCVWLLPKGGEAESLALRALKLRVGLEAYQQQHGSRVAELLRPEHDRLRRMLEDELPQAIRLAIQQGVVLHLGVDTHVANQQKSAADLFAEVMERATGEVFTELEFGAAQVDDAALKKLRAWSPPQPLPKVAKDLKLFDDQGKLLGDKPFLKKIQTYIKGRTEAERTGAAIVAHFTVVPYGWPERAVRAGLLALLRGRWLSVRLAKGATLRKQDDAECETWLTGSQLFNKGVLDPAAAPPPPAEIERLTKLLEVAFEKPGNDTLEKLERRADDLFPVLLERARAAHADLSARELPGAADLSALVAVFAPVCELDTPTACLTMLLEKARALVKAPLTEVDALLPRMDLVRAVERVRLANQLDLLRDLRRRTRDAYAPWGQGKAGTPVGAAVIALNARVETTALFDAVEQTLVHDATAFEAYAADYRALHEARHARCAAALAAFEAHTAWASLDAKGRDEARGAVTELDCGADGGLQRTTTDGACGACHDGLADLYTRVEQVELREAKQLRALDALLPGTNKQAPPPPATAVQVEVRSAAALHEFTAKLDALLAAHGGLSITVRPLTGS